MKSRHTKQRLCLGWKVSIELRVSWKASLLSAFGFKPPTDANQFESIPCPVMWKQQFVFLCFPCSLCKRQCYSVSARDSVLLASARGSVVPSLRETVSFWPLREAVLVWPLRERRCCFLYLASSLHARFLPFCLSLA